jgi:hypothetical protein
LEGATEVFEGVDTASARLVFLPSHPKEAACGDKQTDYSEFNPGFHLRAWLLKSGGWNYYACQGFDKEYLSGGE